MTARDSELLKLGYSEQQIAEIRVAAAKKVKIEVRPGRTNEGMSTSMGSLLAKWPGRRKRQ